MAVPKHRRIRLSSAPLRLLVVSRWLTWGGDIGEGRGYCFVGPLGEDVIRDFDEELTDDAWDDFPALGESLALRQQHGEPQSQFQYIVDYAQMSADVEY